MLTKVVVLSNHQLTTDAYIGKLRKKLTKVNSERLALGHKLTETEERLRGSEATLEGVWGQLDGEKASATILQASMDEMKSRWEAEKEKTAREAVTAYMEFEAFSDETTEFFINGFEALHHRALRAYPDLNIFMFRADVESDSVAPKPTKEADVEMEKDDGTS